MIKRREFISFLGGAIGIWPLRAQAQQRNKIWRIGYIEGGSQSTRPLLMAAFRRKLRELGYADGQYEIDENYADGQPDRVQELANGLIGRRPDVILAVAPQPAFAVARASSVIPIVFVGVGDPVSTRLVASLALPGANVTGLSMMAVELAGKRLEPPLKKYSPIRRALTRWQQPINTCSAHLLRLWCKSLSTVALSPQIASGFGQNPGIAPFGVQIMTHAESETHSKA